MKSFTPLIVLSILLIQACSFTQKMKTGEMAYEYKHYQVAIQMLEEEYASTRVAEVKARKAFLVAESYIKTDDLKNALPWYRKAYENQFGNVALQKYAGVLKRLEQYESALTVYDALLKDDPGNPIFRNEKGACERAIRWKNNPASYEVSALAINSPFSDYAPTLYEQNQLIFTSDRSNSSGEELYAWTGNKYSDFYITSTDLTQAALFSPVINSKLNEGTISFSSAFSEAFFTRCGIDGSEDGYCKLYHSKRKRFGWSEPEVLSFVQDGYNYMHPTIASSDSLLIFSAELEGGTGGYDLYVALRSRTGWEEPQLMSTRINTPDNEKFPYLLRDTLFYASDRNGGLGGLDIYKTYLMDNGSWSPSAFLPSPINSGADDFGIVILGEDQLQVGETQKGYFTSSRNAANKDDIFLFVQTVPDQEPVVVEKEKEIEYELFLALKIYENQFQNPNDPNSEIIGKAAVSNALVILNNQTYETDAAGVLIQEITYDNYYTIESGKPGYLRNKLAFTTSNTAKDPDNPIKTINKELIIDKIFEGKEIILENIYYDLDESFIRDDAKPTLDTLAEIMTFNPSIKIVLGSHTDCRSDDEYNLNLSHRRAKSAVDYLISKGISRRRLQARGYGKSVLIEKCICQECTEEQHQRNRRTTFAIIQ